MTLGYLISTYLYIHIGYPFSEHIIGTWLYDGRSNVFCTYNYVLKVTNYCFGTKRIAL